MVCVCVSVSFSDILVIHTFFFNLHFHFFTFPTTWEKPFIIFCFIIITCFRKSHTKKAAALDLLMCTLSFKWTSVYFELSVQNMLFYYDTFSILVHYVQTKKCVCVSDQLCFWFNCFCTKRVCCTRHFCSYIQTTLFFSFLMSQSKKDGWFENVLC